MQNLFKKYGLLITAIICLLYGAQISYEKYYYSKGIYLFSFICGLLILLFFWLKPYKEYISRQQAFALVPIFIIYFLSWYVIDHFLRFGIFAFSTLCFLYCGLLLYNSKSVLGKLFFIAAYLISSLNILSVLFFIAERTRITRPLINTLFITNPTESSEYLKAKFSVFHVFIIVLFIVASLALFFSKSRGKEPATKMSFKFLAVFTIAFGLASFSGPFGALSSEYYLYLKNKEMLKNLSEERSKGLNQISISYTIPQNAAKKIIVIIGESLNRNMMSLYGYSKNTTPNLLALSEETKLGKLFYFDNVISPEATTVPALKKVLTNINNENNIPFTKAVSLVDLYKKAGFETFWISNQAQLGKYDTPNAVISASADHVYFTSSNNNIQKENVASGNYYDEELLPIFNQFSKEQKQNKQIYFIHLMGSHWFYGQRYPSAFNVFKTDKIDDLNSYLNTVLYNDMIVSSIIKMAQEKGFDEVCYFSDHGEDMKNQHNQEKYTKEMSIVPLIFYLSNNYLSTHQDLEKELLKNKHTPAMTDNLFHDLQNVSGFSSSLYKSKDSFLSDDYVIKKRRVVDNSIPFDK
nr:sulfatase-like hydrolase/transferase [Pseudopedobacter sp.]